MMKNEQILNRLPIPTWRWLKVNHLSLKDLDLGSIPPFIKEFIKANPKEGVELYPYHENMRYLEIEKYFKNRSTDGVSEDLVHLAQTQYNTGAMILIKESAKLVAPLWLSFQLDQDHPTIIDQHLIVAEKNSHSTIIMDYSSEDSSPGFHNGFTRVLAQEGAVVNLIKIQRINDSSLHFDSNTSFVKGGGEVNIISIELGALKSVVSITSNLEGEHASSNLDSIYLTDGDRLLDMNYLMNHFGRRSISTINVQGAMKDRSKKTFKGTLDFKKGAALSKGSEEEYAILLDQDVSCTSIPLLLCQEDDVQGQHAASAGRIDEDQLFYLMSRGFSLKEARKIIIESAFGPIIHKVPIASLQEDIRSIIHSRLTQDKED